MNIHIIHTGGTINASATEKELAGAQKVISPAGRAANVLCDAYYRDFPDLARLVSFSESRAMGVLSENMTPRRWAALLGHISSLDSAGMDGLIITHGTDTLAYTACLLHLMLDRVCIPVALVSANKPLESRDSNGHANFNAAVNLIAKGLRPGVYATYRNSDGVTYLHSGSSLLQCQPLSQDFFSLFYGNAAGSPLWALAKGFAEPAPRGASGEPGLPDLPKSLATPAGEANGVPSHTSMTSATGIKESKICSFSSDFAKVIAITPYVGIDYDTINIQGAAAVMHKLYHSCTAPADVSPAENSYSILSLNARCKSQGIPLFIGPVSQGALSNPYETTALMLEAGITPVFAETFEMAYLQILVQLST